MRMGANLQSNLAWHAHLETGDKTEETARSTETLWDDDTNCQ